MTGKLQEIWFQGSDQELLKRAWAVRYEVFVMGQGVLESLERDESDEQAWHLLLCDDGEDIATGRMFAEKKDPSPCSVAQGVVSGGQLTVWIGRMAVREDRRGQGLGWRLLSSILKKAESLGFTVAMLHSQIHATGFYSRAGFVGTGAEFLEAGITHISMKKELR